MSDLRIIWGCAHFLRRIKVEQQQLKNEMKSNIKSNVVFLVCVWLYYTNFVGFVFADTSEPFNYLDCKIK